MCTILKLTEVMVTQLCECTEKHTTVYFKWVNFMVCKLYTNKAIAKKSIYL